MLYLMETQMKSDWKFSMFLFVHAWRIQEVHDRFQRMENISDHEHPPPPPPKKCWPWGDIQYIQDMKPVI